jgi:hypothetical protein
MILYLMISYLHLYSVGCVSYDESFHLPVAKPTELATGGPPRATKVQLAQHLTTNGGDARPTDKVIARYTRIVVIASSRERT